jgi:prolyl 4-hydroxylase
MTIEAAVQAALSRNDIREAHRLLTGVANDGDGWAAFELARWYLAGQLVPRDLAASRSWFGKAAAAGHPRGQLIHAALLGNGIGGPRQWQDALGALRQASDPQAAEELRLIGQMDLDEDGNPNALPSPEPVSESPNVYWVRSLFTRDECRALMGIAAPFLHASVIVDPATGQMRPDPIRTSDAAMFPWIDETPFIHALNRRLAAASGTKVEQGEPLQVLSYAPGREYRSHSDALPGADNQRILTALVYLNDDYRGGETEFPAAGLRLRGDVGDALIFRNTDAHGLADPSATHAGLPVLAGQKWLASRWIRERPFGR